MRPDAETIAQYQTEGAAVVRGAFANGWADRLLAAHDRLCARADAVAKPDPTGTKRIARIAKDGAPSLDYVRTDDGAFSLRNAVFHDEDFAAWLTGSGVAELTGLMMGGASAHFWFDLSFGKEGDRPETATPWHTDIGSFSFYGQHLPSVWIALTDVPEDNAPMLTAARSVEDARMFRPVFGREGVALPEGYAELSDMSAALDAGRYPVKSWPMQAGDCLFIHPFCWHASLPRLAGAGRRIGFSSRWLGSDVVWAKREMTFDYPDDPRFARIAQDRPPPEDGFPALWRAA